MKNLSIIMPFLNEDDEPINTIESINNTSNNEYIEIIAIDDGSSKKIDFSRFPNVKYIRNKKRIGVDGSRQLGVEQATHDNILVIDAHMRFRKGWQERILNCIDREPKTIWCSTCLVLGYGNMDLNKATDRYYGATILFIDKNSKPDRPCTEILEPKWINGKAELEYELPCVLGANYFFNKDWFNYLHGLKGLKMWGTSEPFLSLKSWMAGGKCKIITDVEIGHKFRKYAPYSTVIWSMVYNKLYLCKTILPEEISNNLIKKIRSDNNLNRAFKEIDRDKKIIEEERKYYESIFKIDIKDFCKKFSIELPQ